jgi:hypothetical protein
LFLTKMRFRTRNFPVLLKVGLPEIASGKPYAEPVEIQGIRGGMRALGENG